MPSSSSGLLRQIVPFALPAIAAALLAPVAVVAQVQIQQPQIVATPGYEPPWPTSFVTGALQMPGRTDLIVMYQGVADPSPGFPLNSGVATGQFLNTGNGTFTYANQNSPDFTATSVVATIADFNGDGKQDVAFATSNAMPGFEDLCVDFGKGGGAVDSTQSGCTTLDLVKTVQPKLTFVAAIPFKTGGLPQLILEDSANGYLYLVQNTGAPNPTPGGLPSFTVKSRYALPATDGEGPILTGDFNADGNMDFIVNGQTGHSASIYFGNGDGTFQSPIRYTFGTGVNSMLLHDMDGDGILDLVTENSAGYIELHHGYADGSFDTLSMGGSYGLYPTLGGGGHLVGIADLNHDGVLDIVTAIPAGISVLFGEGSNLRYRQGGIYNAGPGHSSYAMEDFNGDGNLDLAVDSPEGVAILYGNPDGSFQTSLAFAAGQPAMSGALGTFTSSGHSDAVVSTAPKQAQFLRGNGDGSFTYAGSPGPPVPTSTQTGSAGLWSVIQVGDVDSDGIQDLVLTTDGPPSLLPTTPDGTVIQSGNGDGTFSAPAALPAASLLSPTCANGPGALYGTSAVYPFRENAVGSGFTTPVWFVNVLSADSARRFSGSDVVGGKSFPHLADIGQTGLAPSCQGNAHNLVITGTFTNSPYFSDAFVQQQGHLQLSFASEFGSPFLGDLAIDGSLTTPGQLTAPALSFNFNGPAIPTSAGGLGFPAFIGAAASADLDRDGNTDLLVTYANLSANLQAPTSSAPNYLYIWFGSGNGKFLTSAKHPVNPVRIQLSRNYYQVAVADMNGDGIPDLILSDGYILSIQLGNGDGTFGAETHYLAGQGINSISVGDVNGDGKLDLIIANGGAVLTNPVANLEMLATNPDVNTGGITVLLNHATTPISTITASVAATPEPSNYSNPFSITATIAPSSTNINPVTGSFSFTVDGISVGSATINGTSATLAVPASFYATLAPGVHTLGAAYSGDSFWSASTVTGTHSVSLLPTTTSLILCVDPPGTNFPCANPISNTPLISPIIMYYGQTLDGVAIESALNLTGTITFLSNAATFCTLNANLQQGAQTCPPNSGLFPAGTTTVTAVYSGDSQHSPSTSNPIVVTVLPDVTTATVTTSLNPATFGQPITFTASVQGNFAVGAGSVIFLDGANTLGTATLDPTGHATLTTSALFPGTHPIRVAFPGSLNFNGANSPVVNQVVLPPTTPIASSVALASNLNPSTFGQSVTFTATVTATAAFPVSPTGTVTFFDGPINLGNSTVNSATGLATLSTSALVIGTHSITAAYSGATSSSLPNGTILPSVAPSTSAALTQTVVSPVPPSFTLSVTPSPVTIGAGDTGVLLVSIKAVGGFSQPVALTCSGLPRESACNFVLPVMPSGGGSTTLQLAVSAPHNCDSNTPYFVSSNIAGTQSKAALAVLFGGGILLAGIRRRRKLLIGTIFALLLSFGGLSFISGCGACTDLGTKPGVYSFTVVATAQGSPEVHSQTIPLTVTIP